MSLEKLISKYLDGELTIDEDQKLRSIIASDPEAKAIFEEYIDMSYFLKKDANKIKTPDELKNSVEDKILMRIMSETQFNDVPVFHYKEEEKEKKRRILPIVLPILLTGILIAFVGKFEYDSLFDQTENPSYKSLQLELIQPHNDLSKSKEIIGDYSINKESSKKNPSGKKIIGQNNTNSESEKSNISIKENISRNLARVSNYSAKVNEKVSKKKINEIEKFKIINDKNTLRQANRFGESDVVSPQMSFSPNFLSDPMFANIKAAPFENIFKGRLEFSSLAGTEMMQGGYTPANINPVNNFAQSISFRYSEDQKIGFEFGFNEYTFNSLRRVVVPFPELDGYEVDQSAGDRYTRNGVSTLVSAENRYRTVWAVLFAEKRLVDYGVFDFSGRVGFGATNSGPLAYGRLLGNYQIFNNISLSAGMDFRMFQSNLSGFLDQSNGLKGNVSFVYGININF